jgi:hypothetical protein
MTHASSTNMRATIAHIKSGALSLDQGLLAIEAESGNVERLERLHADLVGEVRILWNHSLLERAHIERVRGMTEERPRYPVDGTPTSDEEPELIGDDKTPLMEADE